jgi:hypothetical protein
MLKMARSLHYMATMIRKKKQIVSESKPDVNTYPGSEYTLS